MTKKTNHDMMVYTELMIHGSEYYVIPKQSLSPGTYWVRDISNKKGSIAVHSVSREDLHHYFQKIVATNIDFVTNELKITNGIFDRRFVDGNVLLGATRGLTDTEMSVLYNFVSTISPNKILEFSCGSGYSTVTISRALIDAKKEPLYFESHDIDESRIKETQKALNDNNIDFVNIKLGDVFDTLDREKLKDVDFLFVDSDHGAEFTKKYATEFFPLLKKGCWVAVHDIRLLPCYVTGETVELFHL